MVPWIFVSMWIASLFGVILTNPTDHDIHKRAVGNTCAFESSCIFGNECYDKTTSTYSCLCSTGTTGSECVNAYDAECASQPCHNGGSICFHYHDGTSYSCICSPGYTGSLCEYGTLDIDVTNTCALEPCRNGGSICPGETTNTYSCICSPGYVGNHCEIPEIDVNECASQPCKNGGTCMDGLGSYMCICEEDFSGKNCEMVL